MSSSAVGVLCEIERLGGRVEVIGDDRLKVFGVTLPAELAESVRTHKRGIIGHLRFIQEVEAAKPSTEVVRAWLPRFGELVQTSDGWSGLVWGATARGLLLQPATGMPVVCVDFIDVIPVNRSDYTRECEAVNGTS